MRKLLFLFNPVLGLSAYSQNIIPVKSHRTPMSFTDVSRGILRDIPLLPMTEPILVSRLNLSPRVVSSYFRSIINMQGQPTPTIRF